MEFFIVSGFWAGHPVEVGRDPFAPYTRELGNLRPEGMFFFFKIIFYYIYIYIMCFYLLLIIV